MDFRKRDQTPWTRIIAHIPDTNHCHPGKEMSLNGTERFEDTSVTHFSG